MNIIEKLADGFAKIEVNDIRVIKLKINKKQFNAIRKSNIPSTLAYENITDMIWGAKIVIDNKLRNPVIIGRDGSKAIFNKKWNYIEPPLIILKS